MLWLWNKLVTDVSGGTACALEYKIASELLEAEQY